MDFVTKTRTARGPKCAILSYMERIFIGTSGWVYFNNDLNVRAPNNAKLLMEMCD